MFESKTRNLAAVSIRHIINCCIENVNCGIQYFLDITKSNQEYGMFIQCSKNVTSVYTFAVEISDHKQKNVRM